MNIYFSGIGGVGIGPLAEIAVDAGYNVQGSDTTSSPILVSLQKRGVPIETSQDGSFLQACHDLAPLDWFVYTSALPSDHAELVLARSLGIRVAKRDELLAHIIAEKQLKLIAVAGTHGKTTTTGMLIWTFQQLGVAVSYSIGTTLSFGPSGKFDPASECFVYECDEFDRNFLHFTPYLSIIPSIDYDHPDTYPTEAQYLEAFAEFGQKSQQIIAWTDQHGELFAEHPNAWLLPPSDVQKFAVAGLHNRRNATLVAKAVEKLGFTGDISSIIEQFPGTDRRFEKLGEHLYSDYGHHPVEIAATLQLAREVSDRVVLVYQPHQNIRQHEIKDQYTDQFVLAEEIYWLPTYLSREDPQLEILTPAELTQNITNHEAVQLYDLDDQLWSAVEAARENGKLVLFMGAGTIDTWVRGHLG